tara:strand:- start:257 stop:532 length:276 start_codon:yes stop_codon:yes gene_type:complete
MANETIAAFRASEDRLNKIQRQVPKFNGTWRIVPNGFQLDVGHGNDYISRILPWFELDGMLVSDIAAELEKVEQWCFSAIEFEPPTEAAPA